MRIRTTKPEYWRSQDTAKLTYFARLLFVGLWNYVDDNGVGEDDEALIRSDLFPRDDVLEVSPLIRGALAEASHQCMIDRYKDSRDGRGYLFVRNWQHQRIDKPTRSIKPLPTSEYAVSDTGESYVLRMLGEGSALYLGTQVPREQVPRDQGSVPPAPDDSPNPFCDKHMPDGTRENCAGCARARQQREVWEEKVQRAAATASRIESARKKRCPDCDDNGMADVGHGLMRCTHASTVRS